ncbi:MAG TPA: CPBP family intramembrane metalloprotease [Spirochaetota bacterium]|nr:CPBP family intramembrane metalloprotease [Spirochaetota bacterium]
MLYGNPQRAFWLSPILLIGFVFAVTLVFSRFLDPLPLTVPLLFAYYGFIWFSIWRYGRRCPVNDALSGKDAFRMTLHGLSPWMIAWTTVYPLAAGIPSFLATAPPVPWGWLLAGIPFALVNGPSEEIFWRLYLERAGRDSGIGEKTRLWYSSAVFMSWHFIFVVFLFPAKLVVPALVPVFATTFISGLLWMKVYQRTGNIVPNIFSHAVLNVLMIWPATAGIVLGVSPHAR